MRTTCVDVSRRYRGLKDAGSCTARSVARIGRAVAIAALALTCLASTAAQAAGKASAGGPSPQPAPASSGAAPTPDPAPQAAMRSTPPRTATQLPRSAGPIAPIESSGGGTTQQGTATGSPPGPARTESIGRDRTTHPAPREHARRSPAVRAVSPSFPLPLPRNLLLLPRNALGVTLRAHREGILLLSAAVAMAVLAVASFTLLRRLRLLVAG